jgi:hypothetical protein
MPRSQDQDLGAPPRSLGRLLRSALAASLAILAILVVGSTPAKADQTAYSDFCRTADIDNTIANIYCFAGQQRFATPHPTPNTLPTSGQLHQVTLKLAWSPTSVNGHNDGAYHPIGSGAVFYGKLGGTIYCYMPAQTLLADSNWHDVTFDTSSATDGATGTHTSNCDIDFASESLQYIELNDAGVVGAWTDTNIYTDGVSQQANNCGGNCTSPNHSLWFEVNTNPCSSITSGAVHPKVNNQIVTILGTVLEQPSMTATFTPNFGLTLSEAAGQCGFLFFNWQQLITNLPSSSAVFQVGNPTSLTAPPAFLDPPPGGYTYCIPKFGSPCNQYPFYWNPYTTGIQSLINYETVNTLSFVDNPGGGGLPSGSFLGFITQLVGICNATPSPFCSSPGGPSVPLFQWSWTDTFNGTSGGISTTYNMLPLDSGSGTGSIGITSINGVELPLAIPATQVSTTSSGLAYSRVTQTFNGTISLKNVSGSLISGPLQILFTGMTAGVTLVNATGNLSGTPYLTIPAVSGLAPGQSFTVTVQFHNPTNLPMNVSPVVHSGSIN